MDGGGKVAAGFVMGGVGVAAGLVTGGEVAGMVTGVGEVGFGFTVTIVGAVGSRCSAKIIQSINIKL